MLKSCDRCGHEEFADVLKHIALTGENAFLPNLAGSLKNQSLRLAGLGQREEALAAIEEAFTIGRDLAAAQPAVFADRLDAPFARRAVPVGPAGPHAWRVCSGQRRRGAAPP